MREAGISATSCPVQMSRLATASMLLLDASDDADDDDDDDE
jgi:hypothetical protein